MSRRREEKKLVEEFIKKSEIPGRYEVEKPIPRERVVGKNKVVHNVLSGLFSLRADIFIKGDDGLVYIVEAKTRMNPSQLGQLLCYKHLLVKNLGIDESKVKLIALVRKKNELEEVFKDYGIEIVELNGVQ